MHGGVNIIRYIIIYVINYVIKSDAPQIIVTLAILTAH